MPNPEIAITVHAPPDRSSEDFELVRYPVHAPTTDWQPPHRKEELPYYMTDDTSARRRVTQQQHPQTPRTPQQQNTQWVDEYDAEGKDVYAKANTFQRYGHGGRIPRRGPPPPPTSIVRRHCLYHSLVLATHINPCPRSLSPAPLARIHRAKLGTCRARRIHAPLLLDAVPQDWQIAERDLGRGALWQVWLVLPQARVLL